MTEDQKQAKPNEEKENKQEMSSSFLARSKRNFPSSRLSDSESEADEPTESKRVKSSPTIFGTKAVSQPQSSPSPAAPTTIQLPVLRIEPSLGGGKALRFPITPRATLLDLKDFVLFSLSIPHYQQVLTFKSLLDDSRVNMSSFAETVLLAEIPGLIDQITGYAASVSLSFKMSSGMDLTPYGNSVIDSENEEFGANGFEFDSASPGPGSELAASLAGLIPLPPGTPANARVLVRSVSKASASNSNLPTLWEVYLPESNIKMLVSAVINIQQKQQEKEKEEEVNNSVPSVPKIVITPPEEETENTVMAQMDSLKLATSPVETTTTTTTASEPKPYCAQCKVRCRPALRFICKCGLTFCQTHRYPDKHACTFDHRAAGMASIQANNPKVVKDKVENI